MRIPLKSYKSCIHTSVAQTNSYTSEDKISRPAGIQSENMKFLEMITISKIKKVKKGMELYLNKFTGLVYTETWTSVVILFGILS